MALPCRKRHQVPPVPLEPPHQPHPALWCPIWVHFHRVWGSFRVPTPSGKGEADAILAGAVCAPGGNETSGSGSGSKGEHDHIPCHAPGGLTRLCFCFWGCALVQTRPWPGPGWIIGCVFLMASFPLLHFQGSCTAGCIPPASHRVLAHSWPFPLLQAMIPGGKLRQLLGSAGTSQQHRCGYSLNRHLSQFQTGFIPSPWGTLGAAELGIAGKKGFLFP